MKWRDTSPVWVPQPIDRLRIHLGARYPKLQPDHTRGDDWFGWLLIEPRVRTQVTQHLGQSRHEQGGLLLGEVFAGESYAGEVHAKTPESAENGTAVPYQVIWITEALASTQYEASSISLRMQSEIWSKARARLDAEKRVIGWYHSHPDLGAFFSSTDEATQAAFFPHDYSLGWVIDPIRQQEAWFRGRHSISVDPCQCLTLPHREL